MRKAVKNLTGPITNTFKDLVNYKSVQENKATINKLTGNLTNKIETIMNTMQVLELENIISEMKNSSDRLDTKINMIEESKLT